MPSGQVYEIIDGVRRAKASQLAGQTEIAAVTIPGQTIPFQVSLDDLRARFNMIDASSSQAAKGRWDRAVAGTRVRPRPFHPILVTPISAKRASKLIKITDVHVL